MSQALSVGALDYREIPGIMLKSEGTRTMTKNQPARKAGLRSRSFWALMATQFLGALNDNAYKLVVVFLVLKSVPGDAAAQVPYLSAVGAVFVLPYLLFSTAAGCLADRFSKRSVLVLGKVGEIIIMGLAVKALGNGSLWMCLGVLFLMGAQSAFFSPAKYGILPELLEDEDLSQGNGITEMLTCIAIIAGTVAGGLMFHAFSDALWKAGLALTGIAAAGTSASLFIERVPAAAGFRPIRLNFIGEVWANVGAIRKDRPLFLCILGLSFFWFIGAVFQLNFPVYGDRLLKLESPGISGLLALTAIGIGAGSFLAGRLSGKKVEFGLVPIGAATMALFSLDLSFAAGSAVRAGVDVFVMGMGSGFYFVPLSAFIQQRAPADKKGLVLAANNFLAFSGVLIASGAYLAAGRAAGLDPAQVFAAFAAMVVIVTAYLFALLPDFLLRLCLWSFTHSLYRLRVVEPERVPREGGALLVCNHVSYMDSLLVMASLQRFVRFIMFRRFYERPLLRWGCRVLRVVPISETDDLREMVRSLREASQAIKDGDLVCIFAEGSITRTGHMQRFQRGFERIMKGVDAPIIPVCIDRMWGSVFSFEGGRAIWKWPGIGGSRVTVAFGEAMPGTAKAHEVRQAVGELAAETFRLRKADQVLLDQAFIASARSRFFRLAMADSAGNTLSYGKALAKALALADVFRRELRQEDMIGVALPASIAGALINAALLLAGKVPVNLNFTTGAEAFRSAMTQCRMNTVLTSRAFVEKVKLPAEPPRTMYAEDLAGRITAGGRLAALLKAGLAPKFLLRLLYRVGRRTVDDAATVIFSSGSTGEPKGVKLSHSNIMSNIEGLAQVFGVDERDSICGVLPFFHSFGFTGTLWYPAVKRVPVAYHPNPLDGRAVGAVVREFGSTALLATPTFLRIYLRAVLQNDFGSLKHVVVGAEKLREELAEEFQRKFGVRPVEGYGCTECSPVVSVNVPDFRARGVVQLGTKPGSIGQPLPGIAVRIVDPETRRPRPVGADGLLLVKGLSVMQGYLGKPELTAEVLQDGWYNTGDIARLDEDGFLTITDRFSRFAKIGGEMVPHIKVEDAIAQALGEAGESEQPLFAVTSVPDEKKGERLVVVHARLPISAGEVCERLSRSGLPNLWLPSRESFVEVERLPVLGTGKLDLRKLKAIATEKA